MATPARNLPTLPQPEKIGERVKYAREYLLKWSQAKLAEEVSRTGYPMQPWMIQRIESGQRPQLGQLVAIAGALGLNVVQLGATSSDYPEIKLLVGAGWDPEKTVALEPQMG